jgi:hypothetical protein
MARVHIFPEEVADGLQLVMPFRIIPTGSAAPIFEDVRLGAYIFPV